MIELANLTMDAHDCILAIVGSRNVPNYASESLIKQAIASHKPNVVVSGAAEGVDAHAVDIAMGMGIPTIRFIPEHYSWEAAPTIEEPMESLNGLDVTVIVPGGFKTRNERIAEACTCLVRIYAPTSSTYGSGWTADYAEKIGKRVTRFKAQ